MDAYLASGNLKDSQNFFFNLSFEFLNGCKFSCAGCHVNLFGAKPLTKTTHSQLKTLMESFDEGSYYKPFIAFINPTDFLVADNTCEVFSDPKVIEILRYFKRISVQTTYLDISKAEQISKILKKHFSDKELEINVIIEPQHIENKKYLDVLHRNQQRVIEIFDWPTKIRSFGIMNVFDYNNTKIAELLKDYDYMHKKVEHLFETTIDFNFSLGRKDEKLKSEEFYDAAIRVKNLFNDSVVSDEKAQYLRFSFGRLSDSLIERQYNWKNGEFYYSPLLYERYVSFINGLKIPIKDYKIEEFEKFEEEVQLSQYENVGDKTECGDCPLLGSCVDRGILYLMDTHNVKDCLVAKKAMNVVNAMGTLPYDKS